MTQQSKENSVMSNKNPLKFLRWDCVGMLGNDGTWVEMEARGMGGAGEKCSVKKPHIVAS